ncbi:MAG: DUF885 domain-containing protein [Chloroflexota bacterium]
MPATTPVDALADRFWAGLLDLSPVWATMLGDETRADRLDDPSPAGRAREVELLRRTRAEAAAIDPAGLGVEERVTLDIIGVVCAIREGWHAHRLWELDAVDQLAGPQTLPGDLARVQRVDGPERVARLVARLAAYPAFMDATIANVEAGHAAGRMPAPVAFARSIEQVRRMVESPVDAEPLLAAHPELPEADRAAIREALTVHVRPALARWLATLERLRPAARAGDGLCHLPDGDALYRFAILAFTSLPEEPQALHDFGRARIAAIADEMQAIARRLGHPDVSALRAALATDPTNHATDPVDLVRLAEGQIARTTAVAPRWFGRLPVAPVQVRAVEAHQEQEAPPAFYIPPAADGSRPGIYYLNTFDPASRPIHRLASTTFHEAVPGHHFQIALEGEQAALPDFRRFGSRIAGGAYAEGWGLYSERLADEMGLYADDRERFGMLEAQAWRAARLVVDTGIHAFGWERERSIALLREAAGLSQLEAETETDRYITWPGQALTYMTGQREIEALRAAIAARDGERFDLRAFHDAVLGHGSLPLATLRAQLPDWVAPRS